MANGQNTTSEAIAHVKQTLWAEVVTKRLNSPLGLVLLLLCVAPVSLLFARLDLKGSILVTTVFLGIPVIIYALLNPAFNLGLMAVSALVVTYMLRFTAAPIGTFLDLLILIGAVGIMLQQFKLRDWSFLKYPLSYMVMIWLFYNLMEVLNPWAQSVMAWLYTVRSVAILQLVFFIGAFAMRDNRKALDRVFYLIMFMCVACAVYGMKQQFLGLSDSEMAWIQSDPERYQLYFQWNLLRIPSFCYDPTTFGILMACFAMLCVALFFGPGGYIQKGVLILMGVMALMTMTFTGTRTAFVLIPVGAFFYMGLYMNKKVLIMAALFGLVFTAFVMKSTTIGVIHRFQSAFTPSKDDSMNLRLHNQKFIQPFIQQNPIGAGLGSCGTWGKRFTPNSWLSSFPHDSSFVRMGVELGWIGLILYSLLHFMVVYTGIYYFFRCQDPLIKAMYAGITTWCFMLVVACYAQEAILQQPMNIIYNIFIAMLLCLKNFDPAYAPTATSSSQKP
jgi:hypothetical protein